MNDMSIAVSTTLSTTVSTNLSTTRQHFLVPDVRCAGCCLGIERELNAMPGVADINVSYAEKRLSFTSYTADTVDRVLAKLKDMGYSTAPDSDRAGMEIYAREKRQLLARLGVAGIGMMQVMMFALAGYLAGPQGMEAGFESLTRWASFMVAVPVTFYSAMPFHLGALRDLRNRTAGMDVPVSLAILAAFSLSTFHTFVVPGEVFFDSACMFTFFLLTGRYLELSARQNFHVEQTLGDHLLPLTAKMADGTVVSIDELTAGCELVVKPGSIVPADATVLEGSASVDESAFTGESSPVVKSPGARLLAGSRNLDGELRVSVACGRPDWVITHLAESYRRAASFKPAFAVLADRVARYFVAVILVLAFASGYFWWLQGDPRYFAIALSVLVVSCPCALSLATPVAYTIATGAVKKLGVLIASGAFLEKLGKVDTVVFDKTGTLTLGALNLEEVVLVDGASRERTLDIAASLEAHSLHPVAMTLREVGTTIHPVEGLRVVPGSGVSGSIAGTEYRIGKPTFATTDGALLPDGDANWVLLSKAQQPLAWFRFSDRLRAGASDAVTDLQHRVGSVLAFSGDTSAAGRKTLREVGIADASMGMTPEDKITGISRLQQSGHQVLMVGDGLNDAGAMAISDLSIAVNPVDSVVQSAADATLVNGDLATLSSLVVYARRVSRTIRQNLTWALAYNLSVIPLAVAGFLPPWMAALGMSLSSLLVTLNACRLSRVN